MTFDSPIPFTEAIEKLRGRGVLPAGWDSEQWRRVPTGIRERAFFSARVESARVLTRMQDYLSDYLAEDRALESHGGLRAQGRAEFVANMRELAIREGLGVVDPETGEIDPVIREGNLQDIRSVARLELIFDTQTEAAQEYGYWQQGQDPDVLEVWPAQRFIRVRPVAAPRPYHEAALGEVRRKDDLEFWVGLNRDFGVPWGPWGFNSGCGVEDVDRDEAVELGVMAEEEEVRPVEREFNEGLQAGVREMGPEMLAALERVTGGLAAGGVLLPMRSPELPRPRGGEMEVPDDVAERMATAMRRTDEIAGDFEDLDVATPEAAALVRGFEARVGAERLEHLKVWTREGRETWSRVGQSDRVEGPPGEALRGRLLSHNHPTGLPFSIEDFAKLVAWRPAEMRAVAGPWLHVARPAEQLAPGAALARWRLLETQAAAVAREEARKLGGVEEGWHEMATLSAVLVELDSLGLVRYKRLQRR